AKIEAEVNKIDGIRATMNFMTKTLTVETADDEDFSEILEKITAIVHSHEPHVKVIDRSSENDHHEQRHLDHNEGEDYKNSAMRIGISGILFILALALKLPPWLEIALFIVSYVVV